MFLITLPINYRHVAERLSLGNLRQQVKLKENTDTTPRFRVHYGNDAKPSKQQQLPMAPTCGGRDHYWELYSLLFKVPTLGTVRQVQGKKKIIKNKDTLSSSNKKFF